MRWVTVKRRRLKYQTALERWQAARAAQPEEEAGDFVGDETPPQIEEPEVDLAMLTDEVQSLLNSTLLVTFVIGLWFTWRGILPGLDILDEVTLWYRTEMVSGEAERLAVTLSDAGLAVIIAVMTVALARRLPSLLQIVLYQRLGMKSSDVYTVTTLSSLCRHRNRHRAYLQHDRLPLVADPVVGCGPRCRYRIRAPGNHCQFHQRPHYSLRASYSRRRRRDRRGH